MMYWQRRSIVQIATPLIMVSRAHMARKNRFDEMFGNLEEDDAGFKCRKKLPYIQIAP